MMKKIYLKPKIRAVEIEGGRLLNSASEEEIALPVDPGTPKDPEEQLSREAVGFSIWDE